MAVCNQLIRYAAENGKYSALKSNSSLKIHSAASGNYGEPDLWFDLAVFRTNAEVSSEFSFNINLCYSRNIFQNDSPTDATITI